MGVKICLVAPIASASGDANVKDQHGHQAGVIGFRKLQRSGTQYLKIGKAAPRDLEAHPVSTKEKKARALFAQHAEQRKAIMADDNLYDTYLDTYQKAVASGQVKTHKVTGQPIAFSQWLMTVPIDESILS